MSAKRSTTRQASSEEGSQNKKLKIDVSKTYLHKTLLESGLTLKHPPDKCIANQETIHIVRNIQKNLQKHFEYPRNVAELLSDLEKECQNWDVFKHYIFPNIIRITEDSTDEIPTSDCVIKILLSIPILQNKLIDYIFEKAIDLAAESKCAPWIKMFLKCLSSLDNIVDSEKISRNLINLLDVTSEKIVRLEIIVAIPDIVGDQEHHNIAAEMSRILSEDPDLVPAILDCLSYLCLSDDQFAELQKKTLNILTTLSKCNYFANFVKFLLMPGRMSDTAYYEAVLGLRNALSWPTSIAKLQDIATSQVLTASAVRNSMISSKITANAWLKVITSCKTSTDHKPIDFIILLILYSTSDEKQKQVETIIRKQIKMDALKEDLLNETFEKFKPILKDYLKTLIDLTNSLLKTNDPLVESFASHIYKQMLSQLADCSQTIVAELLQLGLDCKQCVMHILLILNNVAAQDMSLLKPQSLQMLTLLDRMDDMSLAEVRAVMNLICGLAYSYENSVIRDDIHMIIRKELSSSSPAIKIQGILAGIHAVKYLAATNADEEQSVEFPDDVSYMSVTYLPEGDLREAAQIIELISRSTRQFPDMIAFFYDELSNVVHAAHHINKHFMSWLTDAVTNDLQQNFIVDSLEVEKVGELKLTMQYCLNADSEMDEVIAVNIGGLTLKTQEELEVAILSPLFQLVQTLHSRQQDGNLTSIDALLGCPVVMPKFDIDNVEDMESNTIRNILDCLIHCVNWFRELLNAFATQIDEDLKMKIMKRVVQVEELETYISRILMISKIQYKPPICTFNINKYRGENVEMKLVKSQTTKQKTQKVPQDDSVLPETAKSQATQNQISVKNKLETMHNIPLRSLNLKLLNLFKMDLIISDNESEAHLNIKTLKFLLKCVNDNLEKILISKIKRKTFLTKDKSCDVYDPKKAEECAKAVNEVLNNMVEHLKSVTTYIENHTDENTQNDSGFMYSTEMIEYLTCLEYIYNFFTIYFKWIGFKNHHNALLKTSLRTIASSNDGNVVSLKDLLLNVAKFLQKHEKYCLQLSTAVSLIEFLQAIHEFSNTTIILKILRDMAQNFLSQQWKTPDGLPEKGLFFNQSVDRFAKIYFIHNEIIALKNLTLQLTNDINVLKGRNDTLTSFKCINKGNFPILYRNLGLALHDSAKYRLEKGLSNSEHLGLWKDVASTLKYMSEIAKKLESRNNFSAFFKRSLPVLKIFLSQGIPILELEFKSETQEVLEILKILQQSTRFLQSLCCHSWLKKDKALISKVPYMRQLLETLIYKVKAILAANKCSQAFWMGNLKNKDIHGEVIATQQSVTSEESVDVSEDGDEQLPDDEDSDSDNDLNPNLRGVSEIL